MKARIKWVENVTFLAESDSGHAVIMDGAPEYGGKNLGPRPMELLLIGMGGCTAFDVVTMLKKSRQQIDNCVVELEAKRSEEVPQIFTHIHAHFILYGKSLKDSQVERAVSLSAEKYCSASIMLGQMAEITHDYELVES